MEIINNITDNIINNLIHFYNVIISNITLDAAIKFTVLYFFILWGAFIIWIVKDITNRTTNILLQVFSILIVIFLTPIFGLPIYLLMRPRRTIFEKYYEEDEFGYEEENEDEEEIVYSCPKCGNEVEESFKFCPNCKQELLINCSACDSELRLDWRVCPYCGEEKVSKKKKKPGVKVEIKKIEKKRKQTRKNVLKTIDKKDK